MNFALSRRKQGFKSPRERQSFQELSFGKQIGVLAVSRRAALTLTRVHPHRQMNLDRFFLCPLQHHFESTPSSR